MSEKEERMVLVIGDRQDIEELAYLYPWEKLDKTKRTVFDRSEAVERMVEAMPHHRATLSDRGRTKYERKRRKDFDFDGR